MNKSESIKNLAAALAKFQSEVKNPTNSADNPFFKSKYAPLNEILNDVRPLLSKHGLSVLQSPGGDGNNITVTTLLMHESGEWIESQELVLKADKPTAQGAGSAITYARRYALSAVLGISSEDDDDGNHASGNNFNEKSKPVDIPQAKKKDETLEKAKLLTRIGQAGKMITNEQKKEIMTKNFPEKKVEQLTVAQLNLLLKEIERVATQ